MLFLLFLALLSTACGNIKAAGGTTVFIQIKRTTQELRTQRRNRFGGIRTFRGFLVFVPLVFQIGYRLGNGTKFFDSREFAVLGRDQVADLGRTVHVASLATRRVQLLLDLSCNTVEVRDRVMQQRYNRREPLAVGRIQCGVARFPFLEVLVIFVLFFLLAFHFIGIVEHHVQQTLSVLLLPFVFLVLLGLLVPVCLLVSTQCFFLFTECFQFRFQIVDAGGNSCLSCIDVRCRGTKHNEAIFIPVFIDPNGMVKLCPSQIVNSTIHGSITSLRILYSCPHEVESDQNRNIPMYVWIPFGIHIIPMQRR